MILYQRYLGAVVLALLILIVPGHAFARSTVSTVTDQRVTDQVLLEKIKILLVEVLRLQALLEEREVEQNFSLVANQSPRKLSFFNRPFIATYLVTKDATQVSSVGKAEQELFNLFTAITGKNFVAAEVAEWRVFRDDYEDLGAFVELSAGTKDWVVGVNVEGYQSNDQSVKESYADLFIHEYAHMLLYNQTDFVKKYTGQFWTSADKLNQEAVAEASANTRFSLMQSYFESAKERFVSDYATLSPDEDLAETFVRFVTEEKPITNSVIDQKIRSFYTVPELVATRADVRDNLMGLGIIF